MTYDTLYVIHRSSNTVPLIQQLKQHRNITITISYLVKVGAKAAVLHKLIKARREVKQRAMVIQFNIYYISQLLEGCNSCVPLLRMRCFPSLSISPFLSISLCLLAYFATHDEHCEDTPSRRFVQFSSLFELPVVVIYDCTLVYCFLYLPLILLMQAILARGKQIEACYIRTYGCTTCTLCYAL